MVKGRVDAWVTLKISSQVQALVNQARQTQRLAVWQARAPDSAAGWACRVTAWTGCSDGMLRWDAQVGCPQGLLTATVILDGCSERAGMMWIRK